jgi:enterochelin esterase-like enzyme
LITLLRALILSLGFLGIQSHGDAKPTADLSLPWVTVAAQALRVTQRIFDSVTVGAPVSYHIYLPRRYSQGTDRLPVLYWLHGTEGGVSGIGPLSRHFDEAVEAGRIPPMIVVFVNGLPRRLWADSKDGASPVETVFIREVIPDVDRNFRTIAAREGRIIEGFSMGGYGAARLGLKHPRLFAGISILAGGPMDLEFQGPRAVRSPRLREQILREVSGGELSHFQSISPWMAAESAVKSLRTHPVVIRQAIGDRDDTIELTRRFRDHLDRLQIDHEYVELPGIGHDPLALIRALSETSGRFYRKALGLER